jgi:hypothetical protein
MPKCSPLSPLGAADTRTLRSKAADLFDQWFKINRLDGSARNDGSGSPLADTTTKLVLFQRFRRIAMNRTLTAAVALAAGLGLSGLAQAQSMPPSSQGTQSMPPATGSDMSTSPSTAPSTATPGANSTSGSQMPQANSGQQNQQNMTTPPNSTGRQGMNDQPNRGGSSAATSPQTIQEAQQELKAQGLYNGPIDGVAGPETQTAISQFQRKQGLPATAMLDQQTLDLLTSRGSNSGNGAMPRTQNR